MFDSHRPWKFDDGLDPGWQGTNAGGGKAMAEEVDSAVSKQALLRVDDEPVLLQDCEDCL
jgi:hypothetical protein